MEKARKRLIKKLNRIFSLGYVPSRENQSYKYKINRGMRTGDLINCFAHACFNLTNNQIKKFKISFEEANAFWHYYISEKGVDRNYITSITEFIESTGLSINVCRQNAKMNYNQWKIAYYYNNEILDFHFMLQEKDGKWSSKLGSSRNLEYFEEVPKEYHKDYKLKGFYAITNSIMRERG